MVRLPFSSGPREGHAWVPRSAGGVASRSYLKTSSHLSIGKIY
jgi:hypothetical protein